MNNRRSYLDSMNAGRRRRPETSLEQLNDTLDELESRIRRPHDNRDERYTPRHSAERYSPYHAAPQRDASGSRWQEPARPDGRVADELNALRDELRQQMGSGLRREFSALRHEIEQAVKNSGGVRQAAELGAEFERLSGMIHKLAERSDDRQINLLRLEMEEVKGALGKLAREETMQSFDRRWDEFDRRWQDIATTVSDTQRSGIAGDRTLQALSQRLEQIADSVNALPTSVALRSLEEKMKLLSGTVDQFAHQQDRIGPEALDAIEDRLNEISRAVAASTAAAHPASFDPEPFERIEARISSLARQLGSVVEGNPANALVGQLADLGCRVEELARRVDVPDDTVIRLSEQIDIISRKLDDTPARPDLDAVFDGLERRFVSLSSMLEQRHDDALAQGQSLFRDLERRLDEVTDRLGTTEQAASAPSDRLLQAMDDRFAELTTRLERQQAAVPVSAPAVDTELLRSLEAQVAGLAAHISRPSAPNETDEISPRLDKIERSIMESRSEVIDAARRAAEEAVRGISMSRPEDAVAVAGLTDDLKTLEVLARKSDERNTKTFEAIHDTLLKIVERLAALETSRASAAPAQKIRETLADTPSFDPVEEALSLGPIDRDDFSGSVKQAEVALEAAATTVRDAASTQAGETAARKSMLGGLTKALSGRKARRAEAAGGAGPDIRADMPPVSELQFEPPAVEADAPLDPQMANLPLEPGSGAPDLNAIMRRVRGERGQPVAAQGSDPETAKSDFIAAARRAAQAAAAEAETTKRSPVAKTRAESLGVGRLFRKSRKPLLLGVALAAIVVGGLQAGKVLLRDGPSAEILAAPAMEDVADVAEAPASEQLAAPEQPVRLVGEAQDMGPAAMPVERAADDAAAWLEEPAAALPAGLDAVPQETDDLPEPSAEILASIPLDAGPVALREAAAAGDPKALFEIGNRYSDGRGVTADLAAAAQWYEKAAEQGLAPAQYRIGNLYEKGIGVSRDVSRAKTWYQLAAGQGNASAMHNLAVLYAMGADGVTDNDSASRWFLEAAELGVRDSQFNLGILAAKGVGMQQNLEEAYKWFALVAREGDNDAAEKRDEIAKALAPEALERAKAAAELWRPKQVDPEANAVEVPESWSEGGETTATVDMRQAVRNIQQILNANGYDAGAADGLMGQRTKNAIASFQKANGMTPTGEVDEPLVRALLERR